MRSLLLGWLMLVPGLCHAADAWRTFTDDQGRQMVAKILHVEAGFVVVELKADGRQIPLDFEKLSEADVAFLQKYKSESNNAKPTAPATEAQDGATDDAAPAGEPEAGLLYPRTRKEIQDGIRKIERRPKPKALSKDVHEATNKLNIYRFLCGVPSDVVGDPEFSKNAEDAALACKKNGGLSHSIGHSTENCNLSTDGNVVASVTGFMEDGGANNRDARGHRAWCLNARMGKVGFGSDGDGYSAMWCMDGSGKSVRGTWSYPGKGLFPIEYMHGNAWSLYGAGEPDSAAKLKVEVFRLPKRPDRSLPASGEIAGREVKVNHVSLGMNAINFEPENPAKRGIYWVRISGGGVHEGYLVELF